MAAVDQLPGDDVYHFVFTFHHALDPTSLFVVFVLIVSEANGSNSFVYEGPMTFHYGSLEQYETYDDYVVGWALPSANELDVNGIAYLSWYNHGTVYSYPRYESGNSPTEGDSLITRFTYPNGSIPIESGLIWTRGAGDT